jgi:hypothetical protein
MKAPEGFKKGWKVFCCKIGKLRSVCYVPIEGGVFYAEEEVVLPHIGCGPLTVFTSRKGARHFKLRMSGAVAVRKVYYKESQERHVWVSAADKMPLEQMLAYNSNCILENTVALADAVFVPKAESHKKKKVLRAGMRVTATIEKIGVESGHFRMPYAAAMIGKQGEFRIDEVLADGGAAAACFIPRDAGFAYCCHLFLRDVKEVPHGPV